MEEAMQGTIRSGKIIVEKGKQIFGQHSSKKTFE